MAPVTTWTRKVKQPRGGYLPVSFMQVTRFDDGCELNPKENLNPGTIGTSVDYLSRVLSGHDAHDVFALPLFGAENIGRDYSAKKYLASIIMFSEDEFGVPIVFDADEDIPSELIHAGVNLSRFDIAFKTSNEYYLDSLLGEVHIDEPTEQNIRIMLRRILSFRRRHNIMDAESKLLSYKSFPGLGGEDCLSGEADIVTEDAIWDCKAMKAQLRATYTAQLLAYYAMLFHLNNRPMVSSIQNGCFNPNVDTPADFTLGFFNPRENAEYSIAVSKLNPAIFDSLAKDMVNSLYMY